MINDWLNTNMVFLILHILGTALGAGAAFTADVIFLTSTRNKILTSSEIRIFKITGNIVWIGLLLLLISGVGLVLERPDIFLHSEKFWAKMTLVAIIMINGLVFHKIHSPIIRKSVGKKFSPASEIIKKSGWIVTSGAISVISWNFVIVLGVLGRTPFTYVQFIGVYIVILLAACGFASFFRKKILSP